MIGATPLGVIVTELIRCYPNYDDLAAFYAPSECCADAERAAEREAHQIACAYGFRDAFALLEYLEEVVSPRWVYESGLTQLVPAYGVRPRTYRQVHWLRWLLEWNTGEGRS